VLVLVLTALIVLGVHRAALRNHASSAEAGALAGKVAAAIVGWLALVAVVAALGVLTRFDARPPRMMILVAVPVAIMALVARSNRVRELLAAIPRTWLVGVQSMRVVVELGLHGLFALGLLPVHLTYTGRNFDIVVGLTAPIVALGIRRGIVGDKALLVWNALSLLVLANIVGMAITTLPGPLHLPWPGVSNVVLATWPFVWLPAFLVPVALFGHVLSLRQLRSSPTVRRAPVAPR
jgi:hypothetical protein